jgi:hypothetical protein
MIVHVVAYGIMITDEFGSPKYASLVKAVRAYLEKVGEPDWICTCPSAEEDQLVLGFSIHVHKEIDFKNVDKKWHDVMEHIPENIKILMKELPEPNVEVMSGHC